MPMPHTSQAIAVFALLSLLAGCAGPTKAPPPAPVATPAPAPLPAPEPEAPPPMPALPVTPAARDQAVKITRGVTDLLQAGKEEEALAELKRALGLDPSNPLAQSFMKQITVDPVAEWGGESFNYTVQPGETLSMIAKRFRNDLYAFYLLARYNDIKVPRQISAGQTLRIPGKAGAVSEPRPAPPAPRPRPPAPAPASQERVEKAEVPAPAPAPQPPAPPPPAPPPPPPPEPTPGELAMRNAATAESNGQLERAMAEFERAAVLGQPGASARADALRKRLIDTYTREARQAFARQDLVGAIRGWDKVLALDPGQAVARSERQRAVDLKVIADKLPDKN